MSFVNPLTVRSKISLTPRSFSQLWAETREPPEIVPKCT